ncbi:hypothetical protein PR202_gb06300 [Eleusine coracana subsp. coracana]|uniref:non-specific serine/threonine protein kinase n=1 Tax=Eleusine coracana subsp. coracana TaxID=191504 RepID=A0AAV5E6R0_ELECO|nr:hypothetical protein PR202_gb06300 [Eleusine coracana subsp. coracana]
MSCLFILCKRRAKGQQSSRHTEVIVLGMFFILTFNPVCADVIGNTSIKKYTYKEIVKSTDNFNQSNKIGEGGFGSVYKGKLKNGTIVAVKVLSSDSRQGLKEFQNELISISDISHDNLVKLYGYCVEEEQRILVYNYQENNSLSQTLLGSRRSNIQFNWRTRVKICHGIAQGLAYLHHGVNPHIVHRDIKASNILLDKDLNPKISDFGLAKLLPPNATHISTSCRNPQSHFLPFPLKKIHCITERRANVLNRGVCSLLIQFPEGTNGILLLQTWMYYEQGDLEKVVDSSLSDDLDVEEACRILKIGLLCTQDVTRHRPDMRKVVAMLKGETDVDAEKISKPAMISDFMDLKVRSMRKVNEIASSSTFLSSIMAHSSPMLSNETTQASITCTEVSDRE